MGLTDVIGGSLISGGSGILGSIIGSISNASINRANIENAWKMAQWNYDKNLEQWNRENAYNSPEQQMERLRAAGLNPNLVYGNGSAVQTAAHSPQMNAQAPTLQPYTNWNLGGEAAVASYMNFKRMENELANGESQRQINDQTFKNMQEQQKQLQIHTDQYKLDYNKSLATYNADVSRAYLLNDKTLAETNLLGEQARQAQSAFELNMANVGLAYEKIEVAKVEAREIASRIARNYAETALINANTEGKKMENQLYSDTYQAKYQEAYESVMLLGTKVANEKLTGKKLEKEIQNFTEQWNHIRLQDKLSADKFMLDCVSETRSWCQMLLPW